MADYWHAETEAWEPVKNITVMTFRSANMSNYVENNWFNEKIGEFHIRIGSPVKFVRVASL